MNTKQRIPGAKLAAESSETEAVYTARTVPAAEAAANAEEASDAPPETSSPARQPEPDPAAPDPMGLDPEGLSPTRFGDWEKNGRCIDF